MLVNGYASCMAIACDSGNRRIEGYLSRWRAEDTIRYAKQAYNPEDVRLMKYAKLRNTESPPGAAGREAMPIRGAPVLAVSYFAAAWLGHNVKAEILVEHLTRMSRQICETPDFHCYAPAAGLKMAFMRHGKWSRVTDERKSPQLELSPDWGQDPVRRNPKRPLHLRKRPKPCAYWAKSAFV